jgi:plasmid stability protein
MISEVNFSGESAVAQIVVRGLDEDVKQRLKRRALHHGRSMEDEIRHILRDAAKSPVRPAGGLGTRIATLFRAADFDLDIPDLQGESARPAQFGK